MPGRRAALGLGALGLIAAACSGGDAPRDAGADTPAPLPLPAESALGGAATRPPSGSGSVGRDSGRGTTNPPTPPPALDPDTARGLVAVVGSLPMTRVTLRDPAGRVLTITGAHAGVLSRLAGVEVWVGGTRSDAELAARDFAVRAVEGIPAVDGRLAERRGALVLVRADGRAIPLPGSSAALGRHVGKRVWVTLSAAGEVQSFGVIE